ncbi:hypothetical protein [Streptomyces sp. NPDC050804]|uniref:hypothetical protein n=1 Tax=Streptomyces sp. NPDC050804 TaxID=3154745 RepID=UPI00344662DE
MVTVHPAPRTPTEHLWWADGWDDRPSEAAVVNALVSDFGSTVDLHEQWKASEGLTALFNEKHLQGAGLTRGALLQARITPPRHR